MIVSDKPRTGYPRPFRAATPRQPGTPARGPGNRWLVLRDGKLEFPLVYADDVVDAIMASVAKKLTYGEVIQIIDPEHLTQEDVVGLAGDAKPSCASLGPSCSPSASSASTRSARSAGRARSRCTA